MVAHEGYDIPSRAISAKTSAIRNQFLKIDTYTPVYANRGQWNTNVPKITQDDTRKDINTAG